MNCNLFTFKHLDFLNAFLGAFSALFLQFIYEKFIKKLFYLKLIGNYFHGKENELIVVIKHEYGENFTIHEYKVVGDQKKIRWKGSYKRVGKSLLEGTYDYDFENTDEQGQWGKHSLHLLVSNKTISVLGQSIIPIQNKSYNLSWSRK